MYYYFLQTCERRSRSNGDNDDILKKRIKTNTNLDKCQTSKNTVFVII